MPSELNQNKKSNPDPISASDDAQSTKDVKIEQDFKGYSRNITEETKIYHVIPESSAEPLNQSPKHDSSSPTGYC